MKTRPTGLTITATLTAAALALTLGFSQQAQAEPLAPMTASPPTFVLEWQNRVDSTATFYPRLFASVTVPLKTWGVTQGQEKPPAKLIDLGLNCFMANYFKEDAYAGVCGPALNVGDLALTLGFGFENSGLGLPWHAMATVYYAKEGFAVFGDLEWGEAGEYHLVKLTYTEYSGYLTAGLMSQRYDGEGILMGINVSGFQFYGAFLINMEGMIKDSASLSADYVTGLFGISYTH